MFLIGILLVCISAALIKQSGLDFQKHFEGQILKLTALGACFGLILGALSLHTYSNEAFSLFFGFEHLKSLVISLEFWFCTAVALFCFSMKKQRDL